MHGRLPKGIDVFKVLQAACINPVLHYKMNVDCCEKVTPADFIVVQDLVNFTVLATYINGELVAENGKTRISTQPSNLINHFDCLPKYKEDFAIAPGDTAGDELLVIEALDGQLITGKRKIKKSQLLGKDGMLYSNTELDILKMAVINRYTNAPVATAWICNFGLQQGAIASSVAHDSHNIIVVGVTDEDMCKAANAVIAARGGISCVSNATTKILELPVAGLMSDKDGYEVAVNYTQIDAMAKSLGSQLSAPFMTLSFMALLVIPHLKLSDRGLFDGDIFSFC